MQVEGGIATRERKGWAQLQFNSGLTTEAKKWLVQLQVEGGVTTRTKKRVAQKKKVSALMTDKWEMERGEMSRGKAATKWT